MLGPNALTLETVYATPRDRTLSEREQLDWHSRAFWISPSLSRFAEVGGLMNHALISEQEWEREALNTIVECATHPCRVTDRA